MLLVVMVHVMEVEVIQLVCVHLSGHDISVMHGCIVNDILHVG